MPRISLGEDLGGGRVGEAKPTLAGGGLAKPSELAPTRYAGRRSPAHVITTFTVAAKQTT